MAWNWHKKRSGASLIIGMVLSVLILTFSLNMAQTIQSTQGNIKRALDTGNLEAAREGAEQKADALAADGQDRIVAITVDGETVEQEIWASTGCPVPTTKSENDYGTGVSSPTIPYYESLDDAEAESINLLEHCYGPNYSTANTGYNTHFFVYPTPVVYDADGQKSGLVASNCEPGVLYDSHKNFDTTTGEFDPLEHPCYWGKLEPGESVRIPLNIDKEGWNLSDISNLKLRLRTPCESGADWCAESERITYDVQLSDPLIDDSETIATWTLEIDEGRLNYGSSKGDQETLNEVNCDNSLNCRDISYHSEITKYRMKQGIYHFNNITTYFDLFYLESQDILSGKILNVVDLTTNKSPMLGFARNLFAYLGNNSSNNLIIFQLNNVTRMDGNPQALVYQIISDRKLSKK